MTNFLSNPTNSGLNIITWVHYYFLTFPACFWIPIIFSNFDYNCSNFIDMRKLQEEVKKALGYQKLFWPSSIWMNCSSDLKNFAFSIEFQKFFSITRTIFSHSKGQIISKRFFLAKDSPKKRTKTRRILVKTNSFGRILEQKKTFRDYLTFKRPLNSSWTFFQKII